jgi:hypothetical protein
MRLDDAGWSVVKPKFWWRKNFADPERSSQLLDDKASGLFKLKLQDKCYNCLSPGHLAFRCSAPSQCWFCLLPGHRARSCPRRGAQRKLNSPCASIEPEWLSLQGTGRFNCSQQQHNSCTELRLQKQEKQPASILRPPPRSLKKTYLQALQESPGMEARYPGDPRGRPARAAFAISATGPIRRCRDDLISKTVVYSFNGNSHEVDSLFAGDMLLEKFNLQHGQYQLIKHFPEQFLIIFSDPRSKQWALDRRTVSYRGRVFHFGDWSENSYARETSFEFRVKVRVEGIPIHCWGEDVAARALGRSCAIHFVQESSRRRERTRSFDLWAWCSDPYDIPKEVWLTVTEPDRELPSMDIPLTLAGSHHEGPTDLKRGHLYTLRNHIEVVEDLTFIRGKGSRGVLPTVCPAREFVWSYGALDSVGEKREYQINHRSRDSVRRDREHDDDDDFQNGRHQGTRHRRSLSGWARASRCRGGLDDCYSSNGRHRSSTPFRRHGQELTVSKSWVPVVKAKKVSFANPLILAMWPSGMGEGMIVAECSRLTNVHLSSNKTLMAVEGNSRPIGDNSRDNSIDSLLSQASASPKVPPLASPLSVDVPLLSSVERETESNYNPDHNFSMLSNDPLIQETPRSTQSQRSTHGVTSVDPILDGRELATEQRCNQHNQDGPTSNAVHINDPLLVGQPTAHKQGDCSDAQLQEFVAHITMPKEQPLIHPPPIDTSGSSNTLLGRSTESPAVLYNQTPTFTKRSSIRLAAKKKIMMGHSRDAISKAQDILIAKLNNAATNQKQNQTSTASCPSNQDNSFEQIARLFSRPLTKEQMEAIMELVNQGKEKTWHKRRGRKVAPLASPTIRVVGDT